jgi:8-oxo-dGTP pyrophosphatase MutT (NUDIX family)
MNLYFNKGLSLHNSIIDNNPINKNHYYYFDLMISNYYLSNSYFSSFQNIYSSIARSSSKNDFINKFEKNTLNITSEVVDKIKENEINCKNIKRCGIIFIKDFLDEKRRCLHQEPHTGVLDNINNTDYLNYDLTEKNTIHKLRKILIVKGKSGIWSLPKGRINIINTDKGQTYSENEYECASREAYEETGIYINPLLLEKLPKIKINRNTYFIMDLNNILFNNGKLGLYIKPLDLVYNFNEPIYKFINFSDYYNINKMDTFEIDEIDWKTIDEMYNLRCNKDIRNLLKKLKFKK